MCEKGSQAGPSLNWDASKKKEKKKEPWLWDSYNACLPKHIAKTRECNHRSYMVMSTKLKANLLHISDFKHQFITLHLFHQEIATKKKMKCFYHHEHKMIKMIALIKEEIWFTIDEDVEQSSNIKLRIQLKTMILSTWY